MALGREVTIDGPLDIAWRWTPRIDLSGRGNSLHEMLDTADGTSYVVMSDGNLSALIVEAVSLDAGSILKYDPLVDLDLAEGAPCGTLIAKAREDERSH